MYTNLQIAELLDATADYLDTHAWAQGFAVKSGVRECAGTAIGQVARDMDLMYTTVGMLGAFVGGPPDVRGVVTFNDVPGRTREEVIQTMRDCAEKLRMSEEG